MLASMVRYMDEKPKHTIRVGGTNDLNLSDIVFGQTIQGTVTKLLQLTQNENYKITILLPKSMIDEQEDRSDRYRRQPKNQTTF